MRVINTETLRFEDIAEENKYAVLSHRWSAASEDEVSYVDIAESRDISHKAGFAKFQGFCSLAAKLGCRYGWDDTCCINKGDPSEVTEAINSMYRWYQYSHICIVYLEDVVEKNQMMGSSWFDRGWTLQELIGPGATSLYNRDWNLIGTKDELLSTLSGKTGVPEDVLSHRNKPSTCSVAQRMSWAATRETTRIEDRAYSLLGIFGVSMTPIYGEREKAFLRLQRAIIEESKDESIFAWAMSTGAEDDESRTYTGLFAPSPFNFLNCGDVNSIRGSKGFSVTNGELSMTLRTLPHSMETYYAILNCCRKGNLDDRIAILVSRLVTENEYVRVAKTIPGGLGLISPSKAVSLKERLIRVSLEPSEAPLNRVYGFWLRTFEPPGHQDCQMRVLSRSKQSSNLNILSLAEEQHGTAGIIHMKSSAHYTYSTSGWSLLCWLKVGFDADFNHMLFLANDLRTVYMRSPDEHKRPTVEIFDQAFDTVLASSSSSSSTIIPNDRTLFDNRWLNSRGGGVPARAYGWPGGVSILRADRQHGISGSLESLNLHISVSLVLAPTFPSSHVQQSTNPVSDAPHIWTIDITDTRDSDPEKDLRHQERDATWEGCMAGFCKCCFNCDTDAVDAKASQRDAAANVTKVLGGKDLI